MSLKITNYKKFDISILPTNITHLLLGNRFNQSLHKKLPPKIQHLEVGKDFSYSLNAIFEIYKNLTHITLSREATEKYEIISGNIPDYVTIHYKN